MARLQVDETGVSIEHPNSVNHSSVLLIDLDNCPHEVLDLERTASLYGLIIASHGNHEPRVPLGMASILGQLIARGQIEIWAMPAGKNSADFGLTFLAGRLAAQQPAGTVFEIASRDKDLDHAVALLKRSGFEARRIDSSRLKSVIQSGESLGVSVDAANLARSLSGKGANSRPARKKTLVTTARARGPNPEAGFAALDELIALNAISYDTQGVPVYDGELLKSISVQAKSEAKRKTEPLPVRKMARKSVAGAEDDSAQMRLF